MYTAQTTNLRWPCSVRCRWRGFTRGSQLRSAEQGTWAQGTPAHLAHHPNPLYQLHSERRKGPSSKSGLQSLPRTTGITASTRRACRREMNGMLYARMEDRSTTQTLEVAENCPALPCRYGNLPTMGSGGGRHARDLHIRSVLKISTGWGCWSQLDGSLDVCPRTTGGSLSAEHGILQIKYHVHHGRTWNDGCASRCRIHAEFLDYGVLHPGGPDAASQRHPEQ